MIIAPIEVSEVVNNSGIIKPSFHLNAGKLRIANSIKNKSKYKALSEVSKNIYSGGIFKRFFVEDMQYGIPYISAQHMMSFNPKNEAKIISKKYTPRQEDMTLEAGQILVSCAGTVGNVRYISSDFSGVIGSQDIIRVLAGENTLPAGFLYAYLSCPTIYNYIQSYVYGSVVPRIEPKTLAKLPVITFDNATVSKTNELVVKAHNLRAQANNDIEKAHRIIEETLFDEKDRSYSKINSISSATLEFQHRLDACFHTYKNQVESNFKKKIKTVSLGELISSPMFTAKRGKRNYVKNGIQFLSTTDISQINPLLVNKYLSWQTDGLDSLIVKEDWILVASSGSEILGSTFLVDKTFHKSAVNQHSIRVIVDDKKISPYYVFAYLSCNKIKEYIRSGIYGSAILTINEDYLANIKVPLFDIAITNTIIELTKSYKIKKQEACYLEKEAIDIVENKIEQWQK